MALPKRQNPGDEDFGSNREECIKVYYEDLFVCTSYTLSLDSILFICISPTTDIPDEPHTKQLTLSTTNY